MDGRYEEVYYDYMVPVLKEFFLAYPNWKQLLTYFPPDIMILEKAYPIYEVINNSNDWQKAYEGELFGVFVSNKIAQKDYIKPTDDINYYKNTLFSTGIKFK